MATIEPYDTKAGKRYRVRYRTPEGRQTDKRGFTTKAAANAYAATVEVEKMRGEYVAPSLGRLPLQELAGDWLTRKEAHAPSYYRTLESAWRIHVEPRWGNTAIADIDVLDVEAWLTTLKATGSPTTVIRAYGVLSGILDDACIGKRLRVNPARGVRNLPRKVTKKHIYLTTTDVDRLADECREPWQADLVYTLVYSGPRWSEAIAVRTVDIAFLRRRFQLHENAVLLDGKFEVGPLKGRKNRETPIPPFLVDRLAERVKGRRPNDLVFPGPDGGYLRRPNSENGWFVAAVRRAEIQMVTPHDLRHTCASLAVSAGANVLAVSRMLGHKNPAETLKTYADLFDSDLDRVAESLGVLRARGVGCGQDVGTKLA